MNWAYCLDARGIQIQEVTCQSVIYSRLTAVGIRGIIPAIALVKLENTTGKLTRDIFSFVAGTSTGAIIAAAITAGVPATRILDFYLNRTPEIFTASPLKWVKGVFFGSMYSVEKLHDLIAEAIDPNRAWTLNNSPIDVLLTAKRISDGMPWYFVRDNPMNSGCTGRLGLVDCTTASAAAPTYFQPWTITEASTPVQCEIVGTLVDGAVGVTGNPVYQACIEAFDYTPDYTPEETITVSLGTGRFKNRKEPKWIGGWLEWILAELLEFTRRTTDRNHPAAFSSNDLLPNRYRIEGKYWVG